MHCMALLLKLFIVLDITFELSYVWPIASVYGYLSYFIFLA